MTSVTSATFETFETLTISDEQNIAITRVYGMICALMTLVFRNISNLPIFGTECEWTDDVIEKVKISADDLCRRDIELANSGERVDGVPINNALFIECRDILITALNTRTVYDIAPSAVLTILLRFFQFKIDTELKILPAEQVEQVKDELDDIKTKSYAFNGVKSESHSSMTLFSDVITAIIQYEKLRVMNVWTMRRVSLG